MSRLNIKNINKLIILIFGLMSVFLLTSLFTSSASAVDFKSYWDLDGHQERRFPSKAYDTENNIFDTCIYSEGGSCNVGVCATADGDPAGAAFGTACSFNVNCRYDSSIVGFGTPDDPGEDFNNNGGKYGGWRCPTTCKYPQANDNQCDGSVAIREGTCVGDSCQANQVSNQCSYVYGVSTGTKLSCEGSNPSDDTQPTPPDGTTPDVPKCPNPNVNASPAPDGTKVGSSGCWCRNIGDDEKCFDTYDKLFDALEGANQCQGRVQGNVTVTGVDGASGNVVAFKNGFRYSGATVNLLKNGKVIDTTKTNDTKGIYKFEGLDSGEHKVELKVPSGYKLVSKAGTVEKSTQNPKDFNIDSCDDEDHQGWIIEKTGGGDGDDDNDDNNSPPPSDKATVKIELAEDPGITNNVVTLTSFSLDSAGNVLSDYTFSDPTPGIKNLCARFTADDGAEEVKCKQIEIVADVPEITDISCVRSGSSVVFDIGGNFFGTTAGRVESGESTLSLQGAWSQSQVKAVLNSAPSQETYPVKLIRFDGVSDETTCSPAGEIQLSVGANYFCSAVPNHVENNVSFVVYDGDDPKASSGKLADETVKINGSGVIEGLNFVFEEGRNYIVSIQSPRSLVRFGEFVAGPQTGGQTNIIDIGLPIGDIAPAPAGDGVINSLDKSLLNRQWDLTKDVERTGDFNDDQRVNSVDWACMRNDFNATDETLDEFSALDSDEETEEE